MVVGLGTYTLHLPAAHSLKEKRRVVKGMRERLRHRFNVSVAEIDDHDLWQKATIGVASVSTEAASANRTLDTILNFLSLESECLVTDHHFEIL